MFVFHQQINFLTFLVCIWLWAALLSYVSACACGFVSGFRVILCRCDLREMFLLTHSVSFHNRDLFPVKAAVCNWEFG